MLNNVTIAKRFAFRCHQESSSEFDPGWHPHSATGATSHDGFTPNLLGYGFPPRVSSSDQIAISVRFWPTPHAPSLQHDGWC